MRRAVVADGSDDLDGADIVVPDRPSRVAGPDGHAGSDADDGHGEILRCAQDDGEISVNTDWRQAVRPPDTA